MHGDHIGKRFRAAEAPREAFGGPIKVNDLFLDEPEVRHLALNQRLTAILSALLDGPPMVCNSLNFMWGSQQPAHFDSWYMPPPVENKMAVSSICLEDVYPDAGPLTYFPGSHKLKPYRFSHGGIHAVEAEMPACRAYLEEQLSSHNMQGQQPSSAKPATFSFGMVSYCTGAAASTILHGLEIVGDALLESPGCRAGARRESSWKRILSEA